MQALKKSLRITIVLPFPVTKPVGGAKIMYEYANRLKSRGHWVVVVHSLRRPFKKAKTPLKWMRLVYRLRKASRPKWFPLDKLIPSLIVDEIADRFLPDADIVFSTWWQMTYAISKLSPAKGKPVNLVQDYEVWTGQEEKVLASYGLPVHHAVIAEYLKKLLRDNHADKVVYFPNAIDNEKFYVSNPIAGRNPLSIIMLYSEEERKGSKYGIEAIKALKNKFSEMQVTLFGVYPKPDGLPEWIQYYRRPENLPALYNEHAIFLSPSLKEGWALPPAEAMACGCAVVCTEIGGHADYAKQDKTALLIKTNDIADIISKTEHLLTHNNRRVQLAIEGNRFLIDNFNWEKSVNIAEEYFFRILS